MNKLTKPRFVVVYPLAICLFLTAHITEPRLRLGILLIFLGEAIRFWANGYVGHVKVNRQKVGRLVTAGPYAFVRHPLYLGSFFVGIGFCVIMGRFWIAAPALALLFLIYRHKMIGEEELLLHEWGDEFKRYQGRVPRYFFWGRYPDPQGQWSWKGIAASREWRTLLWAAVFVILLYFWEESVQEHEFLFKERRFLRIGLFVLALVLATTDGLFEFARRRSKRLARIGTGSLEGRRC